MPNPILENLEHQANILVAETERQLKIRDNYYEQEKRNKLTIRQREKYAGNSQKEL